MSMMGEAIASENFDIMKFRLERAEAVIAEMERAALSRIVWLKDCRDAGYSNMEGADSKEFIYWEKWAENCAAEVQKENKSLEILAEYRRGK